METDNPSFLTLEIISPSKRAGATDQYTHEEKKEAGMTVGIFCVNLKLPHLHT
jgi:hypothetical protein